ncbi:MAG TPA: flavin reductase family protein [Rariglobus sp.]|jgi:flavin reductase (DIM6/NTAB) family NADH-FMN oxidoreductase RutF|nr:flavin reductase family protein [Rariglobus sp.]
MFVDFSTLPPRDAYGWMAGLITPRPIAWVSTISADGRTNLAPFSFFNGVTSNPPTLLFSAVNGRGGTKKDTVLNIEAVPEFVVNIVPYSLAEPMNDCASLLPHGESEFDAFGIVPAASTRVRPPRVALAPAAFECVLHQVVHVGEGAGGANLIIGRIVALHVDEAILGANGAIEHAKLDTIGRLGGDDYVTTRERFRVKRPDR